MGGESRPRLGVLALQGDFSAHAAALARLGHAAVEVRRPEQLAGLDGLAMPGGESTAMLKLLAGYGFDGPLVEWARRGGAILATCAGAILLAKDVANPPQRSYGLLDIDVRRNAYGRQLDSFVAAGAAAELGPEPLEMVFIRAPAITRVGPACTTLAEHAGSPVLVRQGRILAATFHPELTADLRLHRRFAELAAG